MRDENKLYWVWLAGCMGIASREFGKLMGIISDPYEIYRLGEEEIEQLPLSDSVKKRLCDKSLTEAYAAVKYCKSKRVSILGYSDKRYPARLRTIEDPPVVLYCRGKLPDMNSLLCIGMVGTRKMSEYGMRSAYKISYELSAIGACIVSGMALGVDGICACGAIEGGGVTVAVLGCGIDRIYPKAHARLDSAICSSGAVISEYPIGEQPHGYNFPKRNRIISGLCQGLVVVEGARGSGSLITAAKAIEQGRELFALPGKVNESNSEGPNELIQSGANMVLCAEDIVNHYDFLYHQGFNFRAYSKARKNSELDISVLEKYGVSAVSDIALTGTSAPEENKQAQNVKEEVKEQTSADREKLISSLDEITQSVYEKLPEGVFTVDDAVARGFEVYHVVTALTLLEISGLVASQPGGAYRKV